MPSSTSGTSTPTRSPACWAPRRCASPARATCSPPDLSRRLLGLAATDPATALPARRVAGRSAAGLRVEPADPATTVGRIDVWADPATALPLRVEVAARDGVPLLVSEFTQVSDGPPDPALLRPAFPPGAGVITAEAVDVAGALRVLDAPPPPDRLAGRDRVTPVRSPGRGIDTTGEELPGVGVYGTGLATFVLVPLSREIVGRAVDGATAAGGTVVEVEAGRAVRVATPLVSVGARARRRGGSLLIGAVTPDVLDQALRELPGRGRP